MKALLVCALVSVLGASGCKKSSEPDEGVEQAEKPPVVASITDQEAEMGRQACTAYVEQVCACAEQIAELEDDCNMAKARPEALEMSLRAAMAEGNATVADRETLVDNARKIIQHCVQDTAGLAVKGCQPPSPEPSAPR